MRKLEDLKIKIFADGGDKAAIVQYYSKPYVRGLTTNPTLLRKAGVTDYERFAREVLELVTEKPLSLEVLSDDFPEMRRQALKIASWGRNVFVKIPITNTRGASSFELVRDLASEGVQLNITALLSLRQLRGILPALNPDVPSVVSIFAGRIADTGEDPVLVIREALRELSSFPRTELLWASVREVYNLIQAESCGCNIITVTHDILARAEKLLSMDHEALSLETVRMFVNDASKAGFAL